jgi:putative spermidine/putrescine transport system ATP-binding protein
MQTMNSESAGVEVRLDDLTRTFGAVNALDGLDLTLAPGELVSLLGPSGCGKTTALRILAGLDDATSGRVLVDGKDLSQVAANKRDMGMVFQAYSLFPHMTTRQNVEFGLKLRKVSSTERRNRAMEMLELVGLGTQSDRYAHQLSGGQQQRVALARALAFEPSVLLLDEPLSALDAKVRAQLRDEIRRVQQEVGTTTLFVTHDQEEALAMADRVGVMRSGRLEQIAPPEELYSAPTSQFVAEFVGLTNRLAATVTGGTVRVAGADLPTLDGSLREGSGTALVRPESIHVQAAASTGRSGHPGQGTVVTTSFLGAISRLQIDMDDQTRLIAQVPRSSVGTIGAGDRVDVVIDPSPVLVVAD